MDRTLAARLSRPLRLQLRGAASPRRAPSSRAHRPRGAGARGRPAHARTLERVLRAPARALARAPRRVRIALVVCAICVPLLAGAFMWLRHSSFVAVRDVRISGLHGAQAPAVEGALVAAAHRMSTLDVNVAQLRAAAAQFPIVREVRASASLPHMLRITVVEQSPVAALVAGGVRTAVAADGVVLGPGLLSSSLPTLAGTRVPAPGSRVTEAQLLGALSALGAAPAPLAHAVARAYSGERGVTLAMRNGLLVYFGDGSRPHAKWRALEAVLADAGSAGATYVDVRVPERSAAGFPPGVTPPQAPASASGEGAQASAPGESTVAAIAQALSAAGGTTAGSTASNGTGSEPEEAKQGGGAASSQTGSGAAATGSSSASEGEEAHVEPSG